MPTPDTRVDRIKSYADDPTRIVFHTDGAFKEGYGGWSISARQHNGHAWEEIYTEKKSKVPARDSGEMEAIAMREALNYSIRTFPGEPMCFLTDCSGLRDNMVRYIKTYHPAHHSHDHDAEMDRVRRKMRHESPNTAYSEIYDALDTIGRHGWHLDHNIWFEWRSREHPEIARRDSDAWSEMNRVYPR